MIQKIGPVNLKGKVYDSLKKYILSLNIYLKQSDFHLDERQLSEKLGVSRTPIREAVAKLEQEGIVKTVPRRGVFVHRKSKKELIDIVTVWAGLEGYAAHLIIANSTKDESFENNLLEYPQYTKPRDWEGKKVPEILFSGDHAKIKGWRLSQSEAITQRLRPDLWKKYLEKKNEKH